MKVLFDFFPVLVFFLAFKLYGIYAATVVAMGASVIQSVAYWLIHKKFEKMHVIGMVLIITLGGATLFFHDPTFIKWKPTGIYWATALAFLISRYVSRKPLIEKMMENNLQLKRNIWRRLNLLWVSFFTIMGMLNLYVAFNFDTNTWVNFKLFGGLGLTVIFVLVQSLYLARHINQMDTTS